MKNAFCLAFRHVKAHRRSYVSSLFCTTLFAAAVLTSLLVREGFFAAIDQRVYETYGSYTATIYNADLQQLEAYQWLAEPGQYGVVTADAQIANGSQEIPVYLGTMDEHARSLKAIRLKEGSFPQQKDEVAIEASTCLALGLSARPGEMVELPLLQPDGSVQAAAFQLTGILEDYVSEWKRLDSSKNSIRFPPPGILSGQPVSVPLYAHVLCRDISFPEDLGGQYTANYYSVQVNQQAASEKVYGNIILLPLTAFFTAAAFLGVYSVVYTVLSAQQPYFRSLRLLGMSKKLGRRVILVTVACGFLLTLCLSTLASLLFCCALKAVLSLWGASFLLAFSPLPFVLSGGASLFSFALAHLLLSKKVFSESPLAVGLPQKISPRRRGKEPKTLHSMWHNAIKKQYFPQTAISAFLVAFCVFLAVSGSFLAQFEAMTSHSNVVLGNYPEQEDYQLFVAAGGSNELHFHISLPRNMGVSDEDLHLIRETGGLSVNCALIDNMTSHFLLLRVGDASPYLRALQEEGRCFQGEGPKMEEARRLAGAAPGDLLVEPYLLGMDTASARSLYPDITGGYFDEKKFQFGEEILAPDRFCQAGDEFLLITPILLEGSPKEDQSQDISFDVRTVRVGAVYASESIYDEIILSSEFIFALDPSCRYEYISLQNTAKGDPQATEQAEEVLTKIAARSENVSLRNIAEERDAYRNTVRSRLTGIFASIAVFAALLVMAFALSGYVRAKAGLHSYLLMRTLGAKGKTVFSLLLQENWLPVLWGGVAGLLASLPCLWYLTARFDYIPYQSILWTVTVPAFLATFLLLFLCSALAARKPVRKILKRSLTEALSRDE